MKPMADDGAEAMSTRQRFIALFGQIEHAMKRCDFLVDHKESAEADWDKLSKALGEEFFQEVAASGRARTLLAGRPRKLKRQPRAWRPAEACPVTNVKELFVNGVCQVRNNLVHGEKFRGAPESQQRDAALVAESEWVLSLVLEKLPRLRDHL